MSEVLEEKKSVPQWAQWKCGWVEGLYRWTVARLHKGTLLRESPPKIGASPEKAISGSAFENCATRWRCAPTPPTGSMPKCGSPQALETQDAPWAQRRGHTPVTLEAFRPQGSSIFCSPGDGSKTSLWQSSMPLSWGGAGEEPRDHAEDANEGDPADGCTWCSSSAAWTCRGSRGSKNCSGRLAS